MPPLVLVAVPLVAVAAVGLNYLLGGKLVDHMTRPGRFFSWSELKVHRSTPHLDNVISPGARNRLQLLVEHVLDPLRERLGRPVTITSGYRSPEVNRAIGGASTSQHMTGEAVDLVVSGFNSEQLARFILDAGLPFDQLIWYAPERGGHLHVSYTEQRENRREVRHGAATGGEPLRMPLA